MKHSETEFKQWLFDNLPTYSSDYRHFDGNIIEFSDEHKDEICHAFLKCFPSWWDDVLPPCLVKPEVFLHYLYEETEDEDLSCIIRGDIYLSLELHLSDLVDEVYNEVFNIKPEPFAGYERGQ
tara:strand:+ start:223 stop:591 length:369 start_codon:yes stop_codon:yes gene_type:complete